MSGQRRGHGAAAAMTTASPPETSPHPNQADAPARVVCEPPLASWASTGTRSPDTQRDRDAILGFAFDPRARKPATLDPAQPVIATGHQCRFWHPGILAKLLAVNGAAERHGSQRLHLIVDHDAHDAVTLDLPRRDGNTLRIDTLSLGPEDVNTPLTFRPPLDADDMFQRLQSAAQRPGSLLHESHLTRLSQKTPSGYGGGWMSLADQVTAVTWAVLEPWLGDMPVLRSSQLLLTDPGRRLMERMIDDAPRCVRAYNAAVLAHPEAGIEPLVEHRNWVELPVWHLGEGRRRRVWVDRTDSRPTLVDETLTPIEPDLFHPAPRALLLSAFMRAFVCDRFIHGTGGAVYDRATEAWWQRWHDRPLRPNAVVTADVYLPTADDLPTAEPGDVARAQWRAHHVPHNIDRVLGLDDTPTRRKAELLEHMDDDRDKRRRRRAFDELHRINRALQQAHPDVIRDAHETLQQAQIGRHNARVLARRDWPVLMYLPEQLHDLANRLKG